MSIDIIFNSQFFIHPHLVEISKAGEFFTTVCNVRNPLRIREE